MTVEPPPHPPVAPVRAPRLVTAGVVATAVGAAGVGASIPALLSDVDPISVGAACGFALIALVGAGLIQRGRATRPDSTEPTVAPTEVEGSDGETARPVDEAPAIAHSPLGREDRNT
jgi:hypothetical protein